MDYKGLPQPIPSTTGHKSKGTMPHGRGKPPNPSMDWHGRKDYRPGSPKSHQGPTQIGPMRDVTPGTKKGS